MALGPQTLSSDHHSPRSDEIENEDIEIENPPSLVSSSPTTERREDEEKKMSLKAKKARFSAPCSPLESPSEASSVYSSAGFSRVVGICKTERT